MWPTICYVKKDGEHKKATRSGTQRPCSIALGEAQEQNKLAKKTRVGAKGHD